MEIVTWVLSGALAHQDSEGHSGVITPGLAQRMSAGRGVRHSEINAVGDEPVHFVQMWVLPDEGHADPSYAELDVNDALARGGLVPVVSGRGHDAAISLGQRDAVLWAARLTPGETVAVPAAPYVHLYVADGSVDLEAAAPLSAGDAARLTGAGGPAVTAGAAGAELLVWEMAAAAPFA